MKNFGDFQTCKFDVNSQKIILFQLIENQSNWMPRLMRS